MPRLFGYPPTEPMSTTIRQIEALARLDDEAERELEAVRVRARDGDESWQQWLEEYERGEAMLLKLRVSVVVSVDDREERFTEQNHGVWVEDHAHPPKVEQQVAELAHKDFAALARKLREVGAAVRQEDLDEMFVAVTLGDDVQRRLSGEHRHLGEAVDSTPGLTS